jgi:hypothetical protein
MSFLRVASVGLVLAGCSIEQTSNVEQHLPLYSGCDDWGCGSNSPEIDHLGIHDVHGKVGGPANANGFHVTRIQAPPCALCGLVDFDVVSSSQSSLVVQGPFGTLTGDKVKGTIISVESGGTKYDIIIKDVGRTLFWAQLTGSEATRTYDVQWDIERAPGQKREWKSVCVNPPNDGSADLLGMNAHHSVVFENDWIDAAKKTVERRPEAGWFNIGCAGHALAKLHLTGHTAGAQARYPGFVTDEKLRQTTLKMITADYCGTGYAFTVAGQPLEWTDELAWNTYSLGFIGAKEAEWGQKGVTCLNKPRVIANPTPTGSAVFPTLYDDIKLECGGMPPACADDDAYFLNGSHIISSNPF